MKRFWEADGTSHVRVLAYQSTAGVLLAAGWLALAGGRAISERLGCESAALRRRPSYAGPRVPR